MTHCTFGGRIIIDYGQVSSGGRASNMNNGLFLRLSAQGITARLGR